MKTILLPTDFSECAKSAVDFAIKLQNTEECKFVLINSYFVKQAGATMLVSITDIVKQDSIDELNEEKQRIIKAYDIEAENIEIYPFYGSCAGGIKDYLKVNNANLVVMGTKGKSNLEHVIMGSNTWDVIERCNIPVIAIPEDYEYNGIKQALLAYDGKKVSEKVLAPLTWVTQKSGANIVEVTVKKEAALIQDSKFSGVTNENYIAYNDNISDALKNSIDEHDADLLVMIHHKESFMTRLFNPSDTKRLVVNPKIPIMVLQD